jgi:hypothetical protein
VQAIPVFEYVPLFLISDGCFSENKVSIYEFLPAKAGVFRSQERPDLISPDHMKLAYHWEIGVHSFWVCIPCIPDLIS